MAIEKLSVILELITGNYKKEAKEAAQATGQIGNAAATAGTATGGMAGRMGAAGSLIKTAFAGVAVAAVADVIGNLDRLGQKMEANERMADVVFADMAAAARAWADANNEAFGIGENAMLGLLSSTQDLLVPMGFVREEAFDMSKEILNTANALSEWKGGTITAEDAQLRLAKAILGETEGLVELGVKISQADIQTRLAEKGLDKLTGAALQQAKAQVTLELVMERSTDALAAYETRAGSAVAAQKDLEAATADTAETWADIFRPIIDKSKESVSDLADIAAFSSEKMKGLQGDTEETARSLGDMGFLNTVLPGFEDLLLILGEVADMTREAGDESGKTSDKYEVSASTFSEGARAVAQAAAEAVTPIDQLSTAQRLAGDATKFHFDQLTRLGDFLAGKINPILAARDAIIALADAQTIAEDAAREHGRESEEFALAQIEVALKTAEAEAALGTFGANAPASIDAVAQALGITDAAAQILLETLGLLDGMEVTTTIVNRQINLLEQGVIPEGMGVDPGPGYTGPIGSMAHGGPVTAGRPYMVGERGPEMFVPGQSGMIIPGQDGMMISAVASTYITEGATIVLQTPMQNFAQDLQLATILATVNTMVEVQ